MKKKKFWSTVLSATLGVSIVLSGCSSSNSGTPTTGTSGTSSTGTGGTSSEGSKEKNKVSMMNVFFSNTAPSDDGPIVTETERITNTDLDITYVPFNVYADKLNVTLSSGELPQAIMVDNPFITTVINGIESGMFWDITPYLDEFPNLKKYDQQILDNLSINGGYYVIPRPRPLVRPGTIIRKDWLENVGMSEPTTADEFYNLLKAFKDKDPDKNGVNDTYGLMFYENVISPEIFSWFGAPNQWKVDDSGNFVKDIETKEFREALAFVRKLYVEGLINKNFAIIVRNEARKDLYNSRVGLTIESIDAVVPFYYLQMKETKNVYDMTVGPPVNNKAYADTGNFGGALIPKTSVKTEEELKKVLSYFNAVNSDEAKAEFVRIVKENALKPAEEQFNLDDLKNLITTDAVMYPISETDTDKMLNERMVEYAAVGVSNPSNGLISPTQIEKDEQLKTIISDAKTKYVMGEIDDAGFDAAVEMWKKAGGSKVAKEFSELYKNK
ncbi:extracellular solute-binding protein [Paenibacillus nasutitermitis]|uniref:Lipoprotein LipO n=1 Tax=Paenibacillus nasutitermitis TaxID=1652958 RepID=A0A917DNV3_9BACL|nr:extracellular solute-binding protein [Paenibacillus nasutitermitis]GGD52226.1 lipoprotein LipO [Paenibacillus nasutitermitis]